MNRVWPVILRHLLPPILFLVAFLVLWQAWVVVFDVKVFLVPSPLRVLQALREQGGVLLSATCVTGAAAFCGFCCSVIVGTTISYVFSEFIWIRRSCYPYAIFLQTVPIVAIAPIIITWFGDGFRSIVLVASIISLFPIITNVTTGLTSVPPSLQDLFRVHRATAWQTQWKLRFPFALRYQIVGAKTSSGLAVVGAIVGEFFAGHGVENPGLGYVIQSSKDQFKTDVLFAAVVLSTLLGMLVFVSVSIFGATVLRRWTRT